MLHVLLFLSYYELNISGESQSYFQKFSFLEYYFNKNAHYRINFSLTQDMVFGFATKKEINQIEALQYSQEYCNGLYNISNIQYLVSNGSEIEGVILSKGVLTPYAFTCDKTYNITSTIEYNNGPNHLDYRLQFLYFFIFSYFVIITIVGIGYILYFIIYSFKQKYCKYCKMIPWLYSFLVYGGIMIILFFFFFFQISVLGAFFENSENDEYSNYIEEFGNKANIEDNNTEKYVDYSYSIMAHLFIMFIYIIIAVLFVCRQLSSVCYKITMVTIMFVLFITNTSCQTTFSQYASSIVFHLLLAIFCIFCCKETRMMQISMAFYFVGTFVSLPIGQLIIRKMHDNISHHHLAMILAIVFMICHFLSVVFLILAIIVFKEFEQFPVGINITIQAVFATQAKSSSMIQKDENILLYSRNQINY